jgi:hypothetical protein
MKTSPTATARPSVRPRELAEGTPVSSPRTRARPTRNASGPMRNQQRPSLPSSPPPPPLPGARTFGSTRSLRSRRLLLEAIAAAFPSPGQWHSPHHARRLPPTAAGAAASRSTAGATPPRAHGQRRRLLGARMDAKPPMDGCTGRGRLVPHLTVIATPMRLEMVITRSVGGRSRDTSSASCVCARRASWGTYLAVEVDAAGHRERVVAPGRRRRRGRLRQRLHRKRLSARGPRPPGHPRVGTADPPAASEATPACRRMPSEATPAPSA